VTTKCPLTIAGDAGFDVQLLAGKSIGNSSVKPEKFVGHASTRLPPCLARPSVGGALRLVVTVIVLEFPLVLLQLAVNPVLVTPDAALAVGTDGGFGSVVTLIVPEFPLVPPLL